MKRISGYLLVILGFIHVSLGVVSGWPQVKAVFTYGLWNALGQQPQNICMKNLNCLQVNTVWWFILWGTMLILFGVLCAWIEKSLQRNVPVFISLFLLIISSFSAILIPASGFWFVMLIAIYMIICSRTSHEKNL